MGKKHIIVGTAGHIDHGKSTIVKILTGTDPDRLIEEQKRGITIDLGFAYLDLDQFSFSFVDVPGHENYLKNMVAGAIGFDICICAVDINEGVMPQTIEHTNIVKFLGVDFVVVVLTKIDKSLDDISEKVKGIEEFFLRYRFGHISFIRWSVFDSSCKEELIRTLIEYAKIFKRKVLWDCFLLHVDRVFSLKGFGTVVTGSVLSGELSKGGTIRILPKGITTKVKGLSVHNEMVETVKSGFRSAINLYDVEKDGISRGDLVTDNEDLVNYNVIYGEIDYFDTGSDFKLKHGGEYTFLVGTAVKIGRLYFINDRYVRVVFHDGYPFLSEMKMLIRIPSPKITVAGIRITFVDDVRMKKSEILDFLDIISHNKFDALKFYLKRYIAIPKNQIYQKFLVRFESSRDEFILIKGDLFLKEYVNGIIEEFKDKLNKDGKLSTDDFESIDNSLLKEYVSEFITNYARGLNFIVRDGEIKSRDTDFESLCEKVYSSMKGDISLSNVAVLSEYLKLDKDVTQNCLKFLINKGMIKRIDKSGNCISVDTLKKFFSDAVILCKKDGYIDINNVKKIINAPRKILIPLLELLDASGSFINKGNKRYLKVKNN